MNCPICKLESVSIKNLSQTYIKDALSKHFNTLLVPDDIIDTDYKIELCSNCTLEFANPPVSGNDSFYSWITKQPNYYPTFRWEYGIVSSLIIAANEKVKVIDIGCGSGDFLETLVENNNIIAEGIDTTESSVKICKDKRLNVSCVYLEDIIKNHKGNFDFVTSFHVLEHVPHPFDFVFQMKELLRSGGSIFLSTPYSPMSFESDWFDPLNYPPHHMGRWNEKSYKKLAESLDMEIEFIYPKTLSILKRSYFAFMLKNNIRSGWFNVFKHILLKPLSFKDIYRHQFKRVKLLNGEYAPDLVLVRLKKN